MDAIIAYYLPRIQAVTPHEWVFYLGMMVILIAAVFVAKVNRGER